MVLHAKVRQSEIDELSQKLEVEDIPIAQLAKDAKERRKADEEQTCREELTYVPGVSEEALPSKKCMSIPY